MAETLGTITVTDKWQTVGNIRTPNWRRVAIYVDRYKRDSKDISIRINSIEGGKSFPFHTAIQNKDEISLLPKHYRLDDDTLDAFFIEELNDVVGEISVQIMAGEVGEKADDITIKLQHKIFK
jgi:hypothetical protein